MKLTTILFVAAILGGCATGTARIGARPDLSRLDTVSSHAPAKPLPAVLLGRDGETASHLYARLLARACAADETAHVVAQVEDFLAVCKADGQGACEFAACDKLRNAMPPRCTDRLASL